MTNEDFLEQIKEAEAAKQNSSSLEICATAKYSDKNKVPESIRSKAFRRSNLYKILFTFFAIGILTLTVQQDLTSNISIGKMIGGYVVSALLIIILFTKVYSTRGLIKNILIETTGITIEDRFFPWNSIAQTAILTECGNYKSIYLVIGLDDLNTYECYELNEFANAGYDRFSRQLSTYIEYFKTKTLHNSRFQE